MGVLPRQLERFCTGLATSPWTASLAGCQAGEIRSGEKRKTLAPTLSAGILPVLSKPPRNPNLFCLACDRAGLRSEELRALDYCKWKDEERHEEIKTSIQILTLSCATIFS